MLQHSEPCDTSGRLVVTKFSLKELEREVEVQINIVSSEKIKYCWFCKGCYLANNLPLKVSFMYSIISMLRSMNHVLFPNFFPYAEKMRRKQSREKSLRSLTSSIKSVARVATFG